MRICIFGDSITWGAYDPESGGWANRLRNFLEESDTEVYNLGISGDNTIKLLKRFKCETDARKPDVIIFAIGINDSYFNKITNEHRVEMGLFKDNLKQLALEAKEFTDNIIFISAIKVDESKTVPTPWSEGQCYYNKNIIEYNNEIKKVCQQNDLKFIDVFSLLDSDDLDDGLHPNTEGHKKMFEVVKNYLVDNKIINL